MFYIKLLKHGGCRADYSGDPEIGTDTLPSFHNDFTVDPCYWDSKEEAMSAAVESFNLLEGEFEIVETPREGIEKTPYARLAVELNGLIGEVDNRTDYPKESAELLQSFIDQLKAHLVK